ncbi:hypothetical protein [Allofrancisella frigidaquae]|uniref:Uncharacterized protein n=1 Tax=Allofrancisella frigidaquae TaxID=1085644 RepID=A0A6M3HUY2_9GAMM|nr:hypothetical protein [Allofrancisella frigidaquae]QIV93901.1 hypothetical protein E3E15_00420 [Allofrancisella frigidaquae]
MDNIAFKIQLGVILPKMEEKISNSTLEIFDELVGFVKSGEVDGGEINIQEIREILIKDFEIFLDKKIIPKSEKLKNNNDNSASDEVQETDAVEEEA